MTNLREHCKCIYYAPGLREDEDGNQIPAFTKEFYPTEDLDVARFRCLKCGKIGYYTGLWADFFEKGIPCPGSAECFPNGPTPPPIFIPKANL